MADGGRPNILDKRIQGIVIEWLKAGNTQRAAAAAAGISFDTLKRWRRLGKAGDVDYIDFYTRTSLATAECESTLVKVIRDAATAGDWKPAAWMLERRFSKEWWKSSAPAKEKDVSKLSPSDLRDALLSELGRIADKDNDSALADMVAQIRGKQG